ncbi:VOC family protein [Advenella alkanexedens]|uniref:VOC family protein n=1 Tax=Advenella alkanexedens TaxID=1481665 RepID=A0ABS6NLM6_9BURK|nr:VOC family protein [Advenella alkanexedens]MBV4396530.1 VOC family protein [Advenella alkanexedens]
MITSLAYFGATSPDYKEWESFGPSILGCELVEPGPDGAVCLRFDEMAYRVAIHPGEENGVAYVGWETTGIEGAGQVVARLEAYGIKAKRASEDEAAVRKVIGFYWFIDPAGIRHELIWGHMRSKTSFHPGRAMSGFRTGDQGLGHVVFAVPDLEQNDRFYRDVLGFKLSDTVDMPPIYAFFYHVNGRHHSLAVARAPGDKAAFLHLMIETRSLDDVGAGLDLCLKHDIPITRTLGCHTNDRMVSFYLQSPANFRIEYGWGGEDVDDLCAPRYYDQTSSWGHHPQHPELSPFLPIKPANQQG